ncbi:MAG: T9SS type A sorting domain-containing protein [Rhodothermaceae bacterium]|nr:T9SS type A sorting domain-containing protein [Rhodothermaceae bacterium]
MRAAILFCLLSFGIDVAAQPAPPVLIYPENGGWQWVSGDLLWAAVDGAVSYQAQVAVAGSDFGDVLIDTVVTDTSWYGNIAPGFVEWRVSASDGSRWGEWSEVWSFESIFPVANEPDTLPEPALELVSVYPNPSFGTVTLSIQSEIPQQAEVRVFDSLGRQLTRSSLLLSVGRQEIRWDATGWPSGIYTVSLLMAGRASSQLVMLVR